MNETCLFCLPHAGGSAGFYLPLKEFLPPWLHLVPLELPGRGLRSAEPLCTEFEHLVKDAVTQIREQLIREKTSRYALFGHSMGAWLGYYAARELTAMPPSQLFFSSPPEFWHEKKKGGKPLEYHKLPHEAFFAVLRKMGGLSADVLASPILLAYIEPIIRADFAALASCRFPLLPPLDLPFTLFGGSEEPLTMVSHWAARTTGNFTWRVFPGGHFYFSENWERLACAIAECCGPEQPAMA